MAGPFILGRGQTQFQIPTNAFLSVTRLTIESPVSGAIEMTAGGSPAESDSIAAGVTVLERRFGGVLLAVTNLGPETIRLTTE